MEHMSYTGMPRMIYRANSTTCRDVCLGAFIEEHLVCFQRRRSFLAIRKEEEMKKANLQGVITFNMLISMHKKAKIEYIYLDIGILPAKNMFVSIQGNFT